MEFKVGDKVVFKNHSRHVYQPEYFPTVGALGEIVEIDESWPNEKWTISVRWPDGSTSGNDTWWCGPSDIELANHE